MAAFHRRPDTPVLHCVPGSQYSTKVLAALESHGIEHFVVFAAPQPKDRKLPSGGRAVPELEFKGVGTPDSSAILRFLDKHVPRENLFFPPGNEQVDRLNSEAEFFLDGFADFYNYVHEPTYRASVRASLSKYIPWWAFWVNIDARLAFKRESSRAKCDTAFKRFDGSSETPEPQVRKALDAFLTELEGNFESDEQRFLCGTEAPSAADLAVYSKVCRIMDKNGDVSIGAALPDMLEGHDRLAAWFAGMQELAPLTWKGKRPPAK